MPSLRVLKKAGTTNERLREFFSADCPKVEDYEEGADSGKYKQRKKDYDNRIKFQDRINSRLIEGITFGLKNYQFYSAVDLAWEPPPLAKGLFPLILYAQGKLDLGACVNQLTELKCADQFVVKDDKGKITGIDLPKFFEVSVNLVRSMITRRLAAQSNKYNNLFPYYKYESRSTSQVGKLRADIISQRMDIAADQFDYRHHDTQVYRDGLMYGTSVDFIRASWEKDIQWEAVAKAPEDKSTDFTVKDVCTLEGLGWMNPHPTRTYYDNASPISSIASETSDMSTAP